MYQSWIKYSVLVSSECYTVDPMQFSLDEIRAVANLLKENNLAEIALESTASTQPCRLLVRRAAPPRAIANPAPTRSTAVAATSSTTESHPTTASETPTSLETSATEVSEPALIRITATAVGLFRETDPPLKVGNQVRLGQVVGSVESLKVPNDVAAPVQGEIIDILVEEGQGIEYGQLLLTLRPASV